MKKILLIGGVFFLISAPLWGMENRGFREEEEGTSGAHDPRSHRPQQKESLKFLKKQISSFKKGDGVSEEEILETTCRVLQTDQDVPFSLLERVIDVLRWKNAAVLLNLRPQLSWDLHASVEGFLEERCHARGWSAEVTWLEKPYGFFRKASYEVFLEFHQDIVSFVEKTIFSRGKFNRVLRPVQRIKAIILEIYQGRIQQIACKAMQNAFFYPQRINIGIRLIRLLPALVKLIESSAQERALQTYFNLVISDITASYQAQHPLTCAQGAFQYMILGLRGYDPELDTLFNALRIAPSAQAEGLQSDFSQDP